MQDKTDKGFDGNVVINHGKATMLFNSNVIGINQRQLTTTGKQSGHPITRQ